MANTWTNFELDFIRIYSPSLNDKDLTEKLNQHKYCTKKRSLSAVRKQRQRLGIKKVGWRSHHECI